MVTVQSLTPRPVGGELLSFSRCWNLLESISVWLNRIIFYLLPRHWKVIICHNEVIVQGCGWVVMSSVLRPKHRSRV